MMIQDPRHEQAEFSFIEKPAIGIVNAKATFPAIKTPVNSGTSTAKFIQLFERPVPGNNEVVLRAKFGVLDGYGPIVQISLHRCRSEYDSETVFIGNYDENGFDFMVPTNINDALTLCSLVFTHINHPGRSLMSTVMNDRFWDKYLNDVKIGFELAFVHES